VLTDGQRIERMRRRLEARLRDCTDDGERTSLIDAYNSQVRRMNIRYRRTGLYREDPRPVRGVLTVADEKEGITARPAR